MKQIIDKSIEKVNENEINEDLSEEKAKEENEKQLTTNDSNDGIHWSQVLHLLYRCDTKGLKRMAAKKGLISDRLRQKIWPKLVGVGVVETSPRPDADAIESHPFYTQVVLDVNRSLKRFPPSIGESERISMQDSLIRLIMRVMMKNPELHYFQGYHDICVTFLLILGEEMAFYVVNQLSKTHFRVFMDKTMERTVDLLDIIPIVVKHENQTLSEHLERSEVGTIFALSWLITWFSHVLPTYEDVVRLFDFFIVSHTLMPLYLSVAIVLYKEDHILSTDCDMSSVHHLLCKTPETEQLPIESLIETALRLFDKYPPKEMIKEQEIQKKYRLKVENRKKGLFGKAFGFRYLLNTFCRINFMSITVIVVFCAAFYQFYWNV